MNYKVEGDGEVVVFIHGLSDNLNYWEVISSQLKDNYKVIRLDLRGHGKTNLGEGMLSVDVLTNDLYNLFVSLNIKKAHFVGFSLGGAVVLDFTIKYPDFVSSVVLMSSFSYCDDKLGNILNQFQKAIEKSFEDFYDLILPMVLCPDVINNHKQELELIKMESSKTANISGIKKAIGAIRDFDVSDKLSCIGMDCLILAGKYDDISPVSVQKELNNSINNSKLILLDNVKHNLLVGDNIGVVLDILNDFFKK